jgi:hypothetical protein
VDFLQDFFVRGGAELKVVKQLPMKCLVSVRCGEVPLEKRILRSTLELVSSFVVCPCSVNGAPYTGRRGTPIRFIKRDLPAPHLYGFSWAAARKLLPSFFLIPKEYISHQFPLIQNFLYFQYWHFTLFSPRWQSKVTVRRRCMRARTHRPKT